MPLSKLIRCLSISFVLVCSAIRFEGALPADDKPEEKKRERIGKALDEPVYRDQIRADEPLADELHRLFSQPVMKSYIKEHQADVTHAPAEIDATAAYFDQKHRERIKATESELRDKLKAVEAKLELKDLPAKERKELEVKKLTLEADLRPPGKGFAEFLLSNWKFQRHLYDKFGGGRILWQQGGLEAFDAMRTWLETQEKNGKFEITDPKLRTSFYEYWTTHNHGAFLTNDKDRIRREFLEPEWAPRKPK